MTEFDMLVRQVNYIAKRPSMYGNPEMAESVSKHMTHIALQIQNPGWTWHSTEQFWENTALQLGCGSQFSAEYYETKSYRQQKWGQYEAKARTQIQAIYCRIWETLCAVSKPYEVTARWIEFLLDQPHLLGSPDNLDITLWCLMNLATAEYDNQFKEMYEKECIALRSSAARGLRSLFTASECTHLTISKRNNAENYERVTNGIQTILQNLGWPSDM